MNLLIDKAEKWLNELGIISHRKNNLLIVRNEQLLPLGISPEYLITELKSALNTKNLFCEIQKNSVMISLL
jgi:hypothetical protein